MKEPAVSVAMATYNGERFLQGQLESFARQTLLPFELVVCDDGSTDATLDILHHFATKAPFPVRVHQNETRLRYALNFLRAASLCSGDLIAFSDQDDVWLEKKLELCSTAISETSSVLAIHSGRVVDSNLKPLGPLTPSARRQVCLDSYLRKGWRHLGPRLGMCPGFACVFQSKLLEQVPPDPPLSGPGIGHEYWLYFAAEAAGRIVLIPDALVLYRQHENNGGFRAHPRPERGRLPVLNVKGTDYQHQAEDAVARARLLGDAAARSPEIRPRLTRACQYYDTRAKALARRAHLYSAGPSVPAVARQLVSMVLDGLYRAKSKGGLGVRGLAKDLFAPVVLGRIKRRQSGCGGRKAAQGECP